MGFVSITPDLVNHHFYPFRICSWSPDSFCLCSGVPSSNRGGLFHVIVVLVPMWVVVVTLNTAPVGLVTYRRSCWSHCHLKALEIFVRMVDIVELDHCCQVLMGTSYSGEWFNLLKWLAVSKRTSRYIYSYVYGIVLRNFICNSL
jgi:hypothetical protein